MHEEKGVEEENGMLRNGLLNKNEPRKKFELPKNINLLTRNESLFVVRSFSSPLPNSPCTKHQVSGDSTLDHLMVHFHYLVNQ